MRSKKLRVWFSFTTAAVIFSFATIVFLLPQEVPITAVHIAELPEHSGVGLPIRLFIPKIKVDAPVGPVGLTDTGAMDVPKGPSDAGWFELGKRPGEVGSSVIVGHFGWKDGIPAVFDELSVLRKGDLVTVLDEQNATTTFAVREIANYDPNADASDVFGSSDGKVHLNLVTCEGVWNKEGKSYSQRLVVFTDKV
jgi:sortase A